MRNVFLKVDMLSEMARAQVSLGDLSGAVRTIRQTLELDYSAFPSSLTLCQIAQEQGIHADYNTVIEALDLAERISPEQLAKEAAIGFSRSSRAGEVTWLTYLAEAQAVRGRREKADETLQSALDLMASGRYDLLGREEVLDTGYGEIVMVQTRIGNVPGALKTLEKMSDRGRIWNGMPRIADGLAASGDLSGAFAFVAQMDQAGPKAKALRWIAQSQTRLGDREGAKQTLARIEPAIRRSEGKANSRVDEVPVLPCSLPPLPRRDEVWISPQPSLGFSGVPL